MSVRPKDCIDRRLAEMYSGVVTVNLDNKSAITPEQFWSSMELLACNNKAFMNIKRK